MASQRLMQETFDPYGRSLGTAPLLPSPPSPISRGGPADMSPSVTPAQTPAPQRRGSQRTSPQSSVTPGSKATHVCPQCSRAFSRAEHLERHQTTHLPSNATKSFVCSSCSKGFTRKDVLTRHIRAVHETKKSEVRKSRRKSCRRCAAFKIKCTSGSKGKQSGDRAAEPCEACRKRDVECIFDFGVTVVTDSQDQAGAEETMDFGSEDGHSEPETASSEHSVKRRKTAHHVSSSDGVSTGGMFLSSSAPASSSASAVSPLLLSAARLASQTTQAERQPDLLPHLGGPVSSGMQGPPLELSSADHLLSMATFSNKGLHIPNPLEQHRGFMDPPRPQNAPSPLGQGSNAQSGYSSRDCMSGSRDCLSHLYFPPIRNPAAQVPRQEPKSSGSGGLLNRIAEEDLNAANTLQGVNAKPIDMAGVLPRFYSTDYTHTSSSNGFARSPMFGGGISLNPLHQTAPTNHDIKPGPDDPGGVDPGLELEDNFYFDFGIFDNSTDWLRDWGPNESISPESQPGRDTLESIPDVSFALGLTPGDYNTGTGDVAGITPTTSNARDQPIEPVAPHPPPASSPSPPPQEDGKAAIPSDPPKVGEEDAGAHVPGLPTVSPMKDHANNTDFLPWGWQHGLREEPSRKVTLPPLRQVLTDRHGDPHSRFSAPQPVTEIPASDQAATITQEMRKAMIDVLTLPSTQPPYPASDAAEIEKGFPSQDVLATFIGLYFENFHPILPIIHRPTFCIEKSPSILLVAMVSIGASYSSLKNAKAFADSLSELCKRCLAWMAEKNPAYGRSPFFLTSMCLQNLYAMGSGSTSLYDAADVSRSIIIGNARRIGLFSGAINSSPASSSTSSSTPPSPALRPVDARQGRGPTNDRDRPESPLLETRWHEWREKEGLKRLAWGIFEYDSSFSTLSNRRGAISISDVTIRIPCSESLWSAPDAATWNARLAHEPDIRGFAFYPTIKGILVGRFDAKLLTSWGKRLCAQAMGRIMWDFKELEESVLSVGSFGAASFKPQKELLLRSAMRVCESAVPRADEAEGDRYHWILARLIAHYTHLHAAFPTISLMLNLARKPPPQNVGINDPRIKRLKNVFATDPVGARSLAWHAAQIIALSRWQPVFSPVEGMRLFLAGIVLWGYAQYRRPREETPTSSAASSVNGAYPLTNSVYEEVVRLDLLPWNMPQGPGRVEEWLRYGRGRGSIGMGMGDDGSGGVMEVCGEDGAREVLRVVVGILGSLRVWGLGGEFKNVLEELMARSR